MTNNLLIFLLLSFLLLTVVFFLVGTLLMKKNNNVEKRLLKYFPRNSLEQNESKVVKEKLGRNIIVNLGVQFKGVKSINKTANILEQAAIPLKPEEFFVIRLIVAFVSTLLIVLLTGTFWVTLPSVIVGYWIPKIYVTIRRKKRLERLGGQLAEALGIMANSMRAGFSFMQALQLIGKEMPDPIGPEFDRTVREINYGVGMEEAFYSLMKRLPDKDLELFTQALLIQRSSGGNLAELLETMQETIRSRVRIKDEINTLTAEGRMSAWIITFLPIGIGLYMLMANPDYFRPLLIEPIGWIILGFGGISIFIGWFIMQKIITIEV